MDKRATNKDVAKLAGVSVATVSYVINGRDDMRVPEATKKKVMQAVNFLNYSPNPFAANLKSNLARAIAVRTSASPSFLQDMEAMLFLRSLNETMRQNNYCLSYLPDKTPEKLSAEACICFDMDGRDFHALGNENFIPLVAVDCLINDPIFYQVVPDYDKIKAAADSYFNSPYTYVSLAPANTELREGLLAVFPGAFFISDPDEIRSFDLRTKNLLLTHASLFKIFDFIKNETNIFRYDAHLSARPEVILNCIKNAVNRITVENSAHFVKV